MKYSKSIFPALAILIGLLVFSGCAGKKSYLDEHEKLARNIKLFNTDFESRAMGISSLLVKMDLRENYLMKAPDIKQHVTFDESSIVKIEYFKNGVQIKLSGSLPTEDFNECIVTLRYRLVVLPSNKLETRIVKQRWVPEEEGWVVIPDLTSFLD